MLSGSIAGRISSGLFFLCHRDFATAIQVRFALDKLRRVLFNEACLIYNGISRWLKMEI